MTVVCPMCGVDANRIIAVRFAEEQVDVVYDLAIIERMLKRKPVFAVPCQDCEWKKGHP